MKTAVEFLANVWAVQGKLYTEDIEQAKEIEKEQRIKAYQLGYDTGYKVCEMKFNGLFKSE